MYSLNSLNLRKILDCRSFSDFKTLIGCRSFSHSEKKNNVRWEQEHWVYCMNINSSFYFPSNVSWILGCKVSYVIHRLAVLFFVFFKGSHFARIFSLRGGNLSSRAGLFVLREILVCLQKYLSLNAKPIIVQTIFRTHQNFCKRYG